MNEITLQDLLDKANSQTKRFIKNLEDEEKIERVESVDLMRNEMINIRNNTELKKKLFINDIKSGLGNKIKTNPNRIRVIKKSLGQRIKELFKKVFTKF
jgi:hypothetical protein